MSLIILLDSVAQHYESIGAFAIAKSIRIVIANHRKEMESE